jgi:hypothetical protein
MTKYLPSAFLFVVLASTACLAAPQTMRLDYFHTGNSKQEMFSVDRVVIEPLPWPGDMSKAIDDTNLGKYFFEVRDQKTKHLLYSRGFASIFGEWETTDEAAAMVRTFSESLRFPAPTSPIEIILRKRDKHNKWIDVWSTDVDPGSIFVDRSKPRATGRVIPIQKMGDPSTKVDFLILGDGYTTRESGKFEADARRLTEVLFATSPFKEHRRNFNVWALCPPAAESGISRPSTGIYRDSPLGATYDAFGSERYVLTFDNRALRKVAQFAPYEFIEIITNTRTYGGGGISIFTARWPPTMPSAITFLSMSLDITSQVSPTSTTPRQLPITASPSASSRGNQTRPRSWIQRN